MGNCLCFNSYYSSEYHINTTLKNMKGIIKII